MSHLKHRMAFEEIAEKLDKELGESLKKLVLYGSTARNEETDESDLDLLVVVETEGQKESVAEKAAELGVKHGVLTSAIVKTESEYRRTDNNFRKEIEETGEIYV